MNDRDYQAWLASFDAVLRACEKPVFDRTTCGQRDVKRVIPYSKARERGSWPPVGFASSNVRVASVDGFMRVWGPK